MARILWTYKGENKSLEKLDIPLEYQRSIYKNAATRMAILALLRFCRTSLNQSPRAKVKRASSPTPQRSQHHHRQCGVTPRSSSGSARERVKGHDPNPIAAAVTTSPLRSCRSGGGTTGRSARADEHVAETQRSARSVGTAASLSSSRDGRGLQKVPDSTGRGSILSGRTTARSHGASSVAGLTDSSTGTPR